MEMVLAWKCMVIESVKNKCVSKIEKPCEATNTSSGLPQGNLTAKNKDKAGDKPNQIVSIVLHFSY